MVTTHLQNSRHVEHLFFFACYTCFCTHKKQSVECRDQTTYGSRLLRTLSPSQPRWPWRQLRFVRQSPLAPNTKYFKQGLLFSKKKACSKKRAVKNEEHNTERTRFRNNRNFLEISWKSVDAERSQARKPKDPRSLAPSFPRSLKSYVNYKTSSKALLRRYVALQQQHPPSVVRTSSTPRHHRSRAKFKRRGRPTAPIVVPSSLEPRLPTPPPRKKRGSGSPTFSFLQFLQ